MAPPPLPAPGIRKRWIFSFVFLVIAGVVLAGIAVVVAVVLIFNWIGSISFDAPNDNFPKVQVGMTSAQVTGIMGDTYRRQREIDGSTRWLWPILEGTDTVFVAFKDDKVVGKDRLGKSVVGETVSYPAVGEGGYLLPCKVVREEATHTYLVRYSGNDGKLLLVKSADDIAVGAMIEPGKVRITGTTQVRNPDGDGQVSALIADDTPSPPATSPSAQK